MSSLKYWLWLTNLRGLRNQTRHALLRHFASPEEIFFADSKTLRLTEGIDPRQADLLSNHSLEAADRILGECQRLGIQLLTIQDAAYPGRLRSIPDPPCLLYVRGHLPALDEEAVIAVVGTRNCTPYGISCTERLAYGLASGGAVVASGLARGIDAAASRGALLAGGVTLGVLGNGLDVVYPREHAALYEDVAATGALISEYPPGTEPMPGNFPLRNRILSGISVGALVTEAPAHSGALITASFALEQDRDVFAVPGPIDAVSSRGSNRLIQEGAYLVIDARDILEVYLSRFPAKLGPVREKPAPPDGPAAPAVPLQTESGQAAEESDTRAGRRGRAGTETGGKDAGTRSRPSGPGEAGARSAEAREEAPPPVRIISAVECGIPEEQAALVRLLDPAMPVQAEELIEKTALPAAQVLAALTMLEISGFIRQHPGKRYTRRVAFREDMENGEKTEAGEKEETGQTTEPGETEDAGETTDTEGKTDTAEKADIEQPIDTTDR